MCLDLARLPGCTQEFFQGCRSELSADHPPDQNQSNLEQFAGGEDDLVIVVQFFEICAGKDDVVAER